MLSSCPIIKPRTIKKSYSIKNDILSHPLCPQRNGMDINDNILWRFDNQPHDYTLLNKNYLRERIGKWTDPNSLENIVSNLVKTLEMELTNKIDSNQWVSMASDVFRYRANDGPWIETKEAVEKGSYNILLNNAKKELYDTSMSFEESHETFFNTFPGGFMWEVLKVYSGPPKVAFTWRHWGKFSGTYNGNKGNDELISIYGFGTANVDDKLRIKEFEVWYDMDKFLAQLNGTEYDNSKSDAGFGVDNMMTVQKSLFV